MACRGVDAVRRSVPPGVGEPASSPRATRLRSTGPRLIQSPAARIGLACCPEPKYEERALRASCRRFAGRFTALKRGEFALVLGSAAGAVGEIKGISWPHVANVELRISTDGSVETGGPPHGC